MSVLKNLKIQYRLFAGFSIFMIIILVFSAVGLKNNYDTNKKAEFIVNNLFEKTIAANNALHGMQQVTNSLSIIAFSEDIAIKDEMKKHIAEKRAIYVQELEKIEKLEKTDDGHNLIKKIRDEAANGRDINNRMVTFSYEGKKHEAAKAYMEGSSKVISGITVSIQNLINYQEKSVKKELKGVLDANRRFSTFLIVFCAAALLLGATLSIILTKSITGPIRENVNAVQKLADGDLTLNVSVKRKDEFAAVEGAVKKMVETWKGIVEKINEVAGNVASASHQLSASAEQVSKGSNNQAQRTSQLSTSSEEMSQTVLDIAQNTNKIAQSATDAALMAKKGEEIVNRSVTEVKEIAKTVDMSAEFVRVLGDKSEQIGKIVNVIDDIADQTNLLALNAAIEAARAGEQGRGFAVVADEVKKLAERTAKATSEISSMITTIQNEVLRAVDSMENAMGKVNVGVELASQAGDALKEIVNKVDDLQLMVSQIASATDEMSATSEEISKDIEHIAEISNEASVNSEQTAQAAGSLMNLSLNLQKVMGEFRV